MPPESGSPKLRKGLTFIGVITVLMMIVAPRIRIRRPAIERLHCRNHLKRIGIALNAYHEDYGCFPPAYTVNDDGEALHSWRTLILPYLGHQSLYDQIDLSKPWDAPANRRCRENSVLVYQCASVEIAENGTTYKALIGENAAFKHGTTRSRGDMTDGPSATAIVMDTTPNLAVHWMSPYDVHESYLHSLTRQSQTSHGDVLPVLFADGEVHIISLFSDPAEYRRAITTISGGEDVQEFLR